MIAALPFVVLAQTVLTVGGGHRSRADSVRRAARQAHEDTVMARRDSLRAVHESTAVARRRAALLPVTPAALATAFRDPNARALLERARAARLSQDSTLTAYDATAYERISAGLKITPIGRERLLYRAERSSHVRWQRGEGAVMELTGARAVAPMFGDEARIESGGGSGGLPIPYFPGQERLWFGSELAKADASGSAIVHPLAGGAEAYYTYASGDSVAFQLPGGRRIAVRELRVQPRRASWKTVVGSLWFDTGSGQLVRAVYRLAEPMDLFAVAKEEDGEDPASEIPVWLRPMMTPMTASVNVLTVEYGLIEGRYWLPRSQTAEGSARVGPMRVPFTLGQHFEYESVNTALQLPPLALSLTDTARTVAAREARRSRRERACRDTSATREIATTRFDGALKVLVRVPCDTARLAHAPTLPPSIYASADTLFGTAEMDALVAQALSLQRQGGFSPGPVVLHSGVGYTRFNRIEGLSTAIGATQALGAGYSASALVRLGTDLSPNGELSLTRSNGREGYTLGAYRRLTSADDWRDPFSLGASLNALVFGHDDHVYYRTAGVELVHTEEAAVVDSWRLFAEQQFDAAVHTHFSLAGRLRGGYFPNNIDATNGTVIGLALRKRGSLGENPRGFRALSNVQLEGAAGTFDYTRANADVTLTRPLIGALDGALTLGGGISAGALPTQRLWYLGGQSSVRGQDVGVASGNAYWLTRAELGVGNTVVRPLVFGDLGWAGDRHALTTGAVPVSGAGVGASFLDGLVRVDVAKGIRPRGGLRASLYADARF